MRLRLVILGLMLAAPAARASDFSVESPAFVEGGRLPMPQVNDRAACGSGGGLSPTLKWSAPPPETKSLAVTAYDPDARAGWWHWAIYDLSPGLRGLAEGAGTPRGAVAAANSFGQSGYGGACPPPGPAHHYVFTVWAVGQSRLPLTADAGADAVGAWLAAHALGKASVTATWGR